MRTVAVVIARLDLSGDGIPEEMSAAEVLAYLKDCYAGMGDLVANHEAGVRLVLHREGETRSEDWRP